MPRSSKRTLIIVIIVAALAWFAYGRFMPHGGWGQQGGASPVSVAEVIEREVRQWSEFSGRLVAVDQADIRPQVSGIIEQVYFKDGAMVKKGDSLFTIDPRPYQAAMQSASAKAAFAESQFTRAQSLLSDKAIPQHDFDQRKNDVQVARADLATAKLNLDYTQVRAPISGRVGRAEITAGNLVEAGGSAPILTRVVSSSPIYADFEIDEATFLNYARAGATGLQQVSRIPVSLGISASGDTPFSGHIESFDNRLSDTSGTIRVRAVFDNADGVLVPGLFARIRLGSPTEAKAILITDRAVGTDQNKKFVLVVGEGDKVEHREVQLGDMADGLRVVREGLKPGEKIIVSGLQRVMMPNQVVKPEMVPMDGPVSEPGAQGSGKAKDSESAKPEQPKAEQ